MRAFGNKHLVFGSAAGVMVFLYAPIAVMMLFSFNAGSGTGLPFEGFTMDWYITVINNPDMMRSIWNSIYVGIGTVVLSTLFGVPAAIALDRYDFPGKTAFRRIVMLPIVLPGIITGVSLLGFYLTMRLPLSLNTIILGQGTALMSVMVTEIFARLQQLGKSQTEAALNLGANQWEIFRQVTLPGIRTALIGAMLIAFSISLDELAVTFLLTGRENTLPMTLWSLLRREVTPEVNAVATLMVLISVVLIGIGMYASRWSALKTKEA